MTTKIKKKRIILGCVFILEILTIILFCALVVLCLLSELNVGYAVVTFLILLVEILLKYVIFAQLTNLYPLNSINGTTYKNISKKYLNSEDVCLHLYETENGIWTLDDELCFDMRGYVFPKLYICSYFIRNIHYPIINKNKLRLSELFKSQSIDKFKEFKIAFHSQNNTKERFVVKNGKTKTFPLRGMIIHCRFYLDAFDRYNKQVLKHTIINEDYYTSLK